MKDFTQTLKTFDGTEPLDEGNPIIFSVICINALMATFKDEANLTGIEKLTRYKLAERIFDKPKEVILTEEEKKLIKDLVGKLYSVLVVGQIHKFME